MPRSAPDPDRPALIADFQRSGLTHAAFCRARRFSLQAFRSHLDRLRHTTCPALKELTADHTDTTRFLPVHYTPTTK